MARRAILALSALLPAALGYVVNNGTKCYLFPESLTHFGQPVDDSPSILLAFELCGINGTVIFTDHTFHVNQVLNTTNLINCEVELRGDVVFSTNVPYWLSHSFNVGLQNQSTAWLFGGTNVSILGLGGSLNGNGQTWYDENRGNSNQPGRPITLTIFNSSNVHVDGLSIIQPHGTVNTDGSDTWNSRDITYTNWIVQNGDDCIAAKGNTTNLLVRNVTCYGGSGMTIGSVGQYPNNPDYDENILFEDISILGSNDGAYIKTWQGVNQDSTGNGDSGGGGRGLVRNITFRNFYLENVALPIQITQCIYTESGADICDTSKMQIADVHFENFTGTSRFNVGASLHCAAAHPCKGVYFKDVNILSVNHTLGLPLYNTTLQDEVYQVQSLRDWSNRYTRSS
ncbi:hypothetical protein LTR53_002899 [Teratosphaeriaceae sp. CCFEE 6253]|nr:hypothetical protein LTR53_002899 [Teratosphaeriaceae sp. CCFEE 6253]